MSINFPSNPLNGAIFYAAGNRYIYDSFRERWRSTADFTAVGGGAEGTGDTDIVYDSGSANTPFLSTLDGGSA